LAEERLTNETAREMNIGTVIVIALICGAIAAVIGQKKNFNVGHSFLLGAVLGVIGILIVAVQRPNLPKPPPGMSAVRCPRCNAVQNIPDGQATFECWQCKVVSNTASAGYVAGKWGRPEDTREWLNRMKKQQDGG
jgi:hypothetical protein